MSSFAEKQDTQEWQFLPIKEFAHTTSGGTPKRGVSEYYNGDVPWVKSGDLNDGQLNSCDEFITELGLEKSSAKLFQSGTVLIALYGATIGRLSILNFEAATNQAVCGITLPEDVDVKYVFYYLLSIRRKLIGQGKGGAQPNINQQIVKETIVPLAPPEQQKRIVAKIEELFSHIDAGIEALKKAKQLLKQYRQSVLKAAVTGELTKEWREARIKDDAQGSANVAGGRTPGATKLEPASQLLERILKERRQKWEKQQLKQFKAKGKMPKDGKWKDKYKEPVLPKAHNSAVIPDSWVNCGIEMLLPPDKSAMKTGPFGSLLKKHEHKTEGVPVLGIENIASMQFVPGSKIHIAEKKAKELEGYKVIEGDILISRSGTVGEVCIVPDIGEARISTNLMKLSLMKDGLNPALFAYLFNGSPFVLGQVLELCKGSTRDFLNQDILKKLLLVLPPYLEQIEIIVQAEERFNKIDRLVKDIDIQILKAEKNKQSVLSYSFAGKMPI